MTRSVQQIDANLRQAWSTIVPGASTVAQAKLTQALYQERREAVNEPAYNAAIAAQRASRKAASKPATHRQTCEGCHGSGVLDTSDPVAMACFAPAARRLVTAQARDATAVRPTVTVSRAANLYRGFSSGAIDGEHIRTLGLPARRDLASGVLEHDCRYMTPTGLDRLDSLLRRTDSDVDGRRVCDEVISRGTQAYSGFFYKAMLESVPALTPQEHRAHETYYALRPRESQRSMAEGGTAGFGIPVLIWPEVIAGAALEDAPLLALSRVVSTTSNVWKGVSSTGGGGFTLPGEDVVFADGSPTFSQPVVDIFTLKNWVPFSIEVGQDYPGFAQEMSNLLVADYLDRLSNDMAQGAGGTSGPQGVFTGLVGVTSSTVHTTTSGVIGATDVRKAWATLPERAKVDPSCAWYMSPSVWSQIAALGAPSVTNGLEPGAVAYAGTAGSRLFGEPVCISSYCPAFSGTTGVANFCVVGAFSRYAVAQRVGGVQVELVPHVPNLPTSNLPTGNRGWLAYARYGAAVLDPAAFVILTN
jgi:HK97 family phage major capsid protein